MYHTFSRGLYHFIAARLMLIIDEMLPVFSDIYGLASACEYFLCVPEERSRLSLSIRKYGKTIQTVNGTNLVLFLEYMVNRIIGLKSRVVFQCFKCPKNISFAVNFFTCVCIFNSLLFSRLLDVQISEMGLYFPRS